MDYKLIMLTNAKPGRDEEFKTWYNAHLDDMLRVPGVTGAQCFDQDTTMSPGAGGAYKYLAVYDISTADLGHTLSTLGASVGTDAMPMSDAMAPETWAVVYKARGPHRKKGTTK